MIRRKPLVLLLSLSVSLLGVGSLGAQELFKDLQVLPKNITKPELKAIMKAQSKALGVECEFCHRPPNMAEDTKHKQVAREMMRMTDELNQKWPSAKKKVTCMTCHRGKEEPDAK